MLCGNTVKERLEFKSWQIANLEFGEIDVDISDKMANHRAHETITYMLPTKVWQCCSYNVVIGAEHH